MLHKFCKAYVLIFFFWDQLTMKKSKFFLSSKWSSEISQMLYKFFKQVDSWSLENNTDFNDKQEKIRVGQNLL